MIIIVSIINIVIITIFIINIIVVLQVKPCTVNVKYMIKFFQLPRAHLLLRAVLRFCVSDTLNYFTYTLPRSTARKHFFLF